MTSFLHRIVLIVDRSLGLNNVAVSNAARAVSADRVAARLRFDAAMALAAQPWPERSDAPELTLVGA
jgi:hypothetical protein